MMFADFQEDGIQPKSQHRLKSAVREEARAAEQHLRTRAQMSFGPVTEVVSRLDKMFSTFSGEKNTMSNKQVDAGCGRMW